MAMNLRGQRFSLDLSDDDDDDDKKEDIPTNYSLPSLVRDIKEKTLTKNATAPTPKSNESGFPKHKSRIGASKFKQRRKGVNDNATSIVNPLQGASSETNITSSFSVVERQRIDEENRQRLSLMTSDEIEEERKDILSQLDSSLIEKLLKRANLDEARGDTGVEKPIEQTEHSKTDKITERAQVHIEPDQLPTGISAPQSNGKHIPVRSVRFAEDEQEPKSLVGLQPACIPPVPGLEHLNIHFPSAPSPPDLDPSDPSFLENLHAKYFPNLSADPSKLAWMAPLPTPGSTSDQMSTYYPAQSGIPASALRFNFRGGILPPRIARAVPVTKGLHHHGEAPEAAGYTIPELAHLSRSAYPAQRCIAYQTLGRLLYRLGRGEWGGINSEISRGLWGCVEKDKVLSILKSASTVEGGHQGCKAYAIEAIWLWQKGGGTEC
ncbi:RNA polymerase II-associated protein RBA50 [Erysiphe neolycopersici]|uniref:RNA polymerase II-associated protein RBA50 n=1 Tax=Erysiphe neolycopersici TaxID=212602 RepID=A0A420HT91_9PEZI|nr:RNA polymerase II-associated protein RBA50 [Erysiphe neolycopersici]